MESKCRAGAQLVLMLKLAFCSSDRQHFYAFAIALAACFNWSRPNRFEGINPFVALYDTCPTEVWICHLYVSSLSPTRWKQ